MSTVFLSLLKLTKTPSLIPVALRFLFILNIGMFSNYEVKFTNKNIICKSKATGY